MHIKGNSQTLNSLAFSATLHCFTGCAIGEILGMVMGTAFNWSNSLTIIISIILAFLIGYSLTLIPLFRHGLTFATALGLAFASDTISITIMEMVDNIVILFLPGALNAKLNETYFWISLVISLIAAFVIVLPVNRWLINKGKGHAVLHEYH